MSQKVRCLLDNPKFLWISTLFLAMLAFLFAGLPGFKLTGSGLLAEILNTVFHFLGFAVFSGLLFLALVKTASLKIEEERAIAYCALVLIPIAVLTEGEQLIIEGREASWWDLWVNGLGIFTGITIASLYANMVSKKKLEDIVVPTSLIYFGLLLSQILPNN